MFLLLRTLEVHQVINWYYKLEYRFYAILSLTHPRFYWIFSAYKEHMKGLRHNAILDIMDITT